MTRILSETPKRFALYWLAPSLLLLALWSAPLASGGRTLVLRDTLNTHLGLRAYFADALRRGELPLVDPLRAGGQGLIGNPNVVALYPDNLLLLVSSTLWQLNAHFWLHWFVAFAAAAWLGRAWGLSREGAVGAGAAYAFSGFFVSQLNLYNGVAPMALAPALAAAILSTRNSGGESATSGRRRRWPLPVVGIVWALELLGGDPIVAALALGATLVLTLPFRKEIPWLGAGLALAGGSLVALPQIVETARLLPASFRGLGLLPMAGNEHMSPTPAALLDFIVPFFFGRPDLDQLWGLEAFGGEPPLYFSLAPGLLALALGVVGARNGGRGRGALLALAGVGLLVTFSGGASVRLLALLPAGGLFRFAAKFFLWAALALALLAGRGLECALESERARNLLARASLGLATLAILLATLFALPGNALEEPFRRLFARSLSPSELAFHHTGWLATSTLQALLALAAWFAAKRMGGRPFALGALLVTCHSASQLFLLQPMLPTDDAAFYRVPPPLLDRLPADAVLVHGGFNHLFGRGLFGVRGDLRLSQRRGHEQLYGDAGLRAGRRFEFNYSPEGLDSLLVQMVGILVRSLDDGARVRVLAATGVDRLLLPRPLAPEAAGDALLELEPGAESPCYVYRLRAPLEEAQLLGEVSYAPHVGAAFAAVRSAAFDPRTTAIVAGAGDAVSRPRGRVLDFAERGEEIEVEAESPDGGVLVVRRAWLPIWRASVDGAPRTPVVANVTRLALELSPGRHRVRFWVDRAPFQWALGGAALGMLGLLALALRVRW